MKDGSDRKLSVLTDPHFEENVGTNIIFYSTFHSTFLCRLTYTSYSTIEESSDRKSSVLTDPRFAKSVIFFYHNIFLISNGRDLLFSSP